MRLLISIVLVAITILVTFIMWISGNGFYLTYVPAGTGDGIARYSPLWVLGPELLGAAALFFKKWWGAIMPLAPAFAMSFDIYPAWMILGEPDASLKFHIAVTGLLWAAGLVGASAYRYLDDE